MTVTSANYVRTCNYVEALDNISDVTGTNALSHTGFGTTSATLTPNTTPAVTKPASFVVTMTAGAATIDLTSISGAQGTISGSGLKVQMIMFQGKSGNGAAVTIAKGASNGYTGLGSAFSVTIPTAGAECTFYGNNAAGAVGSTNKTLDVSGTGTDALNVTVWFG